MKRLASIVAVLSTVFAVACSPHRSQARPTVAVPATFSATGTAAMPDRWWLAIDDPTLHHLIDEGLADNPGLLATWQRLSQAEAAMRKEGASRYPTVTGDAGGSGSIRDDGAGATTGTSMSLGLAASYEVDLWGSIGAARDAAVIETRATAADLRAAAITLSAEIASSWYGLVEQRRQMELLDRQVEIAGQTLQMVELRYRHGAIAETDLLRQQQRVESLRGDQALARARIEVIENRIAILLGHAPGSGLPADDTLAPLPPLPATGVPGELVQRRPDVVQSHLRIQAADKRVAQAIADKFPRLSISLRASTSADLPQNLFTNFITQLAGNLVQPILDGGRRQAEVDRARAALAERIHLYRGQVLSALSEVEDALARELEQVRYIESLDQQIALSRGVYERTQQAYSAGAVDYLRVLEAEESLQSLERRRLTAEHELMSYRIALYRALAGGWDMSRPASA